MTMRQMSKEFEKNFRES